MLKKLKEYCQDYAKLSRRPDIMELMHRDYGSKVAECIHNRLAVRQTGRCDEELGVFVRNKNKFR